MTAGVPVHIAWMMSGASPMYEHSVGITDNNVFCGEYGIPALCYGPSGDNVHQCQEWVSISSITRAARMIAGTSRTFLQ
jgi:acetylornithine deacetylase/succinyl-diaminopimelate desuccinylase-like protein